MTSIMDEMNKTYKELGLIDVSTPAQTKRGNVMFLDTKLNDWDYSVTYTFHANGYYRRTVTYVTNHLWGHHTNYMNYQLNPQVTDRDNTKRYHLSRKMIPFQGEQMSRCIKNILSFRKSHNA